MGRYPCECSHHQHQRTTGGTLSGQLHGHCNSWLSNCQRHRCCDRCCAHLNCNHPYQCKCRGRSDTTASCNRHIFKTTPRPDISSGVTWTSSNPALLTIDAKGLATAYQDSLATPVTVTAQSGSIKTTATVNVTPGGTLTALYVEPTSSSIAQATAEQHTAIAVYSNGTEQDVTSVVTWSVSGSTTPIDNSARNSKEASWPSASSALTKPAADQSDPVATINENGVDSAVSPGTTTVVATLGSMQTQSVVIVTPATVTAIVIMASKDQFPVGSTQPIQLIGTFSDGTRQDLSLAAN